MFIGHYAVALAAKKATPKTSLGVLFIAAQFLDLLWPALIVFGIERVRLSPDVNPLLQLDFVSYPYSHSLVGALLWAVGFGGMAYLFRRNSREAFVLAGCVVSHWVLDYFTHIPDLPITFTGDTKVGLGLWNSVVGTMIVETALFAGGIIVYVRCTHAKDRIGVYAFWTLMVLLFLVYMASVFGPPPTDASQVGLLANLAWVFVIWAWWADRHRAGTALEVGGM